MVLSEGFKDILNLKYILKVIFCSNYVIMVGLLAKAESHSNIRSNGNGESLGVLEPSEQGVGGRKGHSTSSLYSQH